MARENGNLILIIYKSQNFDIISSKIDIKMNQIVHKMSLFYPHFNHK
jgi:hypothetical protein